MCRAGAGDIEQVNADLEDSALAHMPSGSFAANAAWLALAAIDHNLTRAAGCLASLFHAWARTGTLRRHLIILPARTARRFRHITLRLPTNWPHRDAFNGLLTTYLRPTAPNLTSTNTRPTRPDRTAQWKNWADQQYPHVRNQKSRSTIPKRD